MIMDSIESFEEFRNYINELNDDFEIIDPSIPIKTQLEYFRVAKNLLDNFSANNEGDLKSSLKSLIEDLFSDNIPVDEKKRILVLLASIEEVEAYNAIKKYAETAPEELTSWVKLAQQQSKLTLENSFLDKKKVLIASGLGGKDDKLRFFVVFIKKEQTPFTDTEKLVVKNELSIALKENNGELEKLYFGDYFVSALILYDIRENVLDLLREVINNTNEYGDFIREEFLVTNVKILPEEEIKKTVDKIFSKDDDSKTFTNNFEE